jgi:hypothetical protein
MPFHLFTNNGKSTLSVAVSSAGQASLTLQSGDGAKFPAVTNPCDYAVTLDDGTNVEVCLVVALSGDVLTVLRGQEGTTAQSSFATGTKCEARVTKGLLDQLTYAPPGLMRSAAKPAANVTSYTVEGCTLPTRVGSDVAGTLTNSSWREQNARVRLTLGNSAQFPIEWRVAQPCVNIANGFKAIWRFGFAIVPNSSHFFLGWINTTAQVASVHPPSSMTNMVGVGWHNAGSLQGTFLTLYWNASGTSTYYNLGSYFSINTQAWYEFELSALPNNTRVDWVARRLDISSIADVGSYLTANIPGNSLWLSPMIHGVSMVTSALAVENGGVVWYS